MLVCILAYPVLVHLSILFAQPVLAGLALLVLYTSFVLKPLAARRPWAWASLALAAAASAWLVQQDAARYVLYLPPIVLPLALLAWWAPTLRAGRTPFITGIATAIRGPLPADYAAHTRAATWLWVWTFALLALAAAGFALWAGPEAWSLLTNFLNPMVVGMVFAGEYVYRRRRFRHLEHPNFIEFIRLAVKAGARPGVSETQSQPHFAGKSGTLPLIHNYRPQQPLLWSAAAGAVTQAAGVIEKELWPPALALSASQFLGAVEALAQRLPSAPCAINLCEDRAHFMLSFAALCVREQTNLLPPSRAPGAVQAIARAYPASYLLCDGEFPDIGVPQFLLRPEDLAAPPSTGPVPQIPATAIAAIAFSSGSTGGSLPHPKSWRNLSLTAQLCAERFLGPAPRPSINIVATVPPQHMYGLELSVMLALAGGCATHAARPLFPADVRDVLQSVPGPRVLVTTPVHLKSLAASRLAGDLAFPPLALVISATAPLSRELAQRAEQTLGAPVFEIYGCTEAGSMCTRRTVESDRWRPYPDLQMRHGEDLTHVSGPHLDQPVSTPDVVETHADGGITLLGRAADMVKIAGKRASLAELTGQLLGLPGVQDGVMFLPAEHEGVRLAALVVAPDLSEAGILDALARQMDSAFLPRPLRLVARLPRNELGKLPRAELLALLESQRA